MNAQVIFYQVHHIEGRMVFIITIRDWALFGPKSQHQIMEEISERFQTGRRKVVLGLEWRGKLEKGPIYLVSLSDQIDRRLLESLPKGVDLMLFSETAFMNRMVPTEIGSMMLVHLGLDAYKVGIPISY